MGQTLRNTEQRTIYLSSCFLFKILIQNLNSKIMYSLYSELYQNFSCKSLEVVSYFYLSFEALGTPVPLVQNGVGRLSGTTKGWHKIKSPREISVTISSYLVGRKSAGKLSWRTWSSTFYVPNNPLKKTTIPTIRTYTHKKPQVSCHNTVPQQFMILVLFSLGKSPIQ